MEKKERHFVLVHGAFHGAWCWYKVATLLKSSGHNVTALDLAASGVHPKQVHELHSISDYYEPLMEFMALFASREKGDSIFSTAMMPGPDFSYASIRKEFARKGLNSKLEGQYTFHNGPDNPPTSLLAGPNYMSSSVYQLSPPEDMTLAMFLIRPVALYGGKISLFIELTEENMDQ
ncbi:hypothetical protein REPUB_Repub09cG0171100 [Reevesia pubescens]